MPKHTYNGNTLQLRVSGGDLLHCLLDDGAFPENQAFRWSLRDVDQASVSEHQLMLLIVSSICTTLGSCSCEMQVELVEKISGLVRFSKGIFLK